ncbi:MAG: hypothetical protein NTY47_09205, partial [Candidatus Omnitrophica bacterium]|nr:hypothetical protein [Candidatus Omnitrophota bacterium]
LTELVTPEDTKKDIRGTAIRMATGEGKTFAAGMALFVWSLPKRGVHLTVPNIDLVERDAEKLLKAFGRRLGVSFGIVGRTDTEGQPINYISNEAGDAFISQRDDNAVTATQAFGADITYTTEPTASHTYQFDLMGREPYARIDDEGDLTHFVDISPRIIAQEIFGMNIPQYIAA